MSATVCTIGNDMSHKPSLDEKDSCQPIEEELYEYIQKNDTEKSMEVLKSSSSVHVGDVEILNKIGNSSNEKSQTDSICWSMLQWACFHGNEKVRLDFLYIHDRINPC
jgi:hypothetical protein